MTCPVVCSSRVDRGRESGRGKYRRKAVGVAQKVLVKVTSDLSGAADAHLVRFGYEGYEYEIDLTDGEHEKLGAFLSGYITAARRAGKSAPRPAAAAGGKTPLHKSSDIRDWARANGHEVSDRGRIPAHVLDAYGNRK